jgi:hypothetical protein
VEPSAGASLRAHGLRALGQPRPLRVEANAAGQPARVTLERMGAPRTFEVEEVIEVWRVSEAWWREAPVRRTYYQVTIDGGRALTLFRDEESTQWFEQRY